MNRRSFLGAVTGAVAVGLSGCTGGDATDPGDGTTTTESGDGGGSGTTTTATPDEETSTATPQAPADVAATMTEVAPMSGRRSRVALEDGTATYTVECGDGGDPERAHDLALSTERWGTLGDRITAADPDGWESYYDCEGDCPTDLPAYRVTVTVDGRTHETGYYGGRQEPLPAGLSDLVDLLDEVRREAADQVESIDCRAQ